MGKFYRNYESEFEIFLKQVMQEHPEIEDQQREGRLIWWDKGPLTPEQVRRAAASDVKMKPYVYS